MNTHKTIAAAASALLLASPLARAATAAENWTQSCASCHGADGAAHTKIGKRLGVKDLTDAATQKTFTDAELFDHLKGGEVAPDGKVKMKAFADKLSDDEIKAIVAYVRTLPK